jgi:hypothetical protein
LEIRPEKSQRRQSFERIEIGLAVRALAILNFGPLLPEFIDIKSSREKGAIT